MFTCCLQHHRFRNREAHRRFNRAEFQRSQFWSPARAPAVICGSGLKHGDPRLAQFLTRHDRIDQPEFQGGIAIHIFTRCNNFQRAVGTQQAR